MRALHCVVGSQCLLIAHLRCRAVLVWRRSACVCWVEFVLLHGGWCLRFCVGRSLLFSSSAWRSIARRGCHARFCVHVLCLCCRRIFCGRCRWAVWSVSCFLVWPSGVFQCAGRSGGRVWQGNSIANGLAEFAQSKSRCGSVVERNRLSQLRFETDERTSCCVIAFLHLAGQSSCSHMP